MKQNAILIGSGLMLGMGVGFFFLRSNPLAFVGCLFLGLGLGLLLPSLIGKKDQEEN